MCLWAREKDLMRVTRSLGIKINEAPWEHGNIWEKTFELKNNVFNKNFVFQK